MLCVCWLEYMNVASCKEVCNFTFPDQPERIVGEEYGLHSDVWSLGISLFELAVGRFPYLPVSVGSAGGSSLSRLVLPSLLLMLFNNALA